jgi:hypothetical protein
MKSMKEPETSTVFTGLDGRTDAELPRWYADQKTDTELVSFIEAICELPRAIDTTVVYRNPYTNDRVVRNHIRQISGCWES